MGTSSGILERAGGEASERAEAERPRSMVERMTVIMETFSAPMSRLTLEEMQDATGLPRSTAHRILNQLIALDWVRHTSAGYALGGRALGLGRDHAPEMDLRSAAAESLHALHLDTGLVVHLGMLDGPDVHILDKVGGAFAARVPSRVGGRVPAYWTALGTAQLAILPPAAVDSIVDRYLLHAPGGAALDLVTLHQELAQVRACSGLVYERGRNDRGLGCVAAPILGREGVRGAVSVVGGPQIDFKKLGPQVLRAARAIAGRLDPGNRFGNLASR